MKSTITLAIGVLACAALLHFAQPGPRVIRAEHRVVLDPDNRTWFEHAPGVWGWYDRRNVEMIREVIE